MAAAFQFPRDCNLYSVLNLPQNASMDEIKQRYRQLVLLHRPDKNMVDFERATERATLLNQAKSILLNPETRLKYDTYLIDKTETLSKDAKTFAEKSGLSTSVPFSSIIKSESFYRSVHKSYKNARNHFFATQKLAMNSLMETFSNFKWEDFRKTPRKRIDRRDLRLGETAMDKMAKSISVSVSAGDFATFCNFFMQLYGTSQIGIVFGKVRDYLTKIKRPFQNSKTDNRRLLYEFILSCVNVYCADSNRYTWMIKMQKYFWYLVQHYGNLGEDEIDMDICKILTLIRLEALIDGEGDYISFLADRSHFDLEEERWNLFKECLPSSDPPKKTPEDHLYFAEIREDEYSKVFIGWTIKDSGQYENFRYEKVIRKQYDDKKIDEEKIGDYYLDLIPACKSSAQYVFALVAASKWYAKSLKNEPNLKKKFILLSLVEKILEQAQIKTVLCFSIPLRYYLSAQALSILTDLSINADCASPANLQVYRQWLDRYTFAVRFCASEWVPNVSVAEADTYNFISAKLAHGYVLDQEMEAFVEEFDDNLEEVSRPLSMTLQELYYYKFEYGMHEHIQEDIDDARATCMEQFFDERKITWTQVTSRLCSTIVERDKDGWNKLNSPLSEEIRRDEIASIAGIKINLKTSEINFVVNRVEKPSNALICIEDFDTAIAIGANSYWFSLNPTCNQYSMPLHPVQKCCYSPDELRGTKFLETFFLADYWMKFMSTGFEINYVPPFLKQEINESNFWAGIPDEIKEALNCKNKDDFGVRMSRFWIQADSIDVDEKTNGDELEFWFGNVKMSVRTHPLIPNEKGELVDTDDNEETDSKIESPEEKFAKNFTKFYDRLSAYSRVFARLKELVKVQQMGILLSKIQKNEAENLKSIDANGRHRYENVLANQRDQVRENFRSISNKSSPLITDIAPQVEKAYSHCTAATFLSWFKANLGQHELASMVYNNIAASEPDFYRVPQSERNRVWADVQTEIQKLIDGLTNYFSDLLHISKADARSLLIGGTFGEHSISEAAVAIVGPFDAFIASIKKPHIQLKNALDQVINGAKERTANLKISGFADFAPAVTAASSNDRHLRIAYGGVAFCPTPNLVSVPKPANVTPVSPAALINNKPGFWHQIGQTSRVSWASVPAVALSRIPLHPAVTVAGLVVARGLMAVSAYHANRRKAYDAGRKSSSKIGTESAGDPGRTGARSGGGGGRRGGSGGSGGGSGDEGGGPKNPPKISLDERHLNHTFRNEEGHLPDTVDNRKMLEDVANNPNCKLGNRPDRHGCTWYGKIREDGKQIWAKVRGGKIINGGLNEAPKPYHPETGLSAPNPPGKK